MTSATASDQATAETSQVADACAPRSLWGWSPAPLPAGTRLERAVDRLLPRTGWALCLFYGGLVGLLLAAPYLPRRGELFLDGVCFLAAGGWCALNFWRCRHAHCVVTAAGWLPLAVFAFAEAVLGRTLIHGFEQPIFLGVLVLGVGFEVVWARIHGTNAVGVPAC